MSRFFRCRWMSRRALVLGIAGWVIGLQPAFASSGEPLKPFPSTSAIGFQDAGDLFSCSPGDHSAIGEGPSSGQPAMRWRFDVQDRWHWCSKTLAQGQLAGMTTMRFIMRSDRRGSLFVQLEERGGETFFATVTPDNRWQPVMLDLTALTPDPKKRQDGVLDPAQITGLLLADNGDRGAIRRTRTVWVADWTFFIEPKATSRSFAMGFTRWPPDFTVEAVESMYAFIAQHGDLMAHHFDGGVPWPEALKGDAFSSKLMEDWVMAKSKTPDTHRVYVAITPLASDREHLARYWGAADNMPLPGEWASYPLNHPNVKTAFLNYAQRVIEQFAPDYFAIGIEVNELITKNRAAWDQYKELHRYVYANLKQRYPQLPIFATFSLGPIAFGDDAQRYQVRELMPYNDLMALSAYPYGWAYPGGALKPVPETFFDAALAFGKPIAIAETGEPSQDFQAFGQSYRFTDADQAQYIDLLLRKAKEHAFVFVVNWAPIDFDRLQAKLPDPAARELASLWAYTGLMRSDGAPKAALSLWDKTLTLPRRLQE